MIWAIFCLRRILTPTCVNIEGWNELSRRF